MASEGKAAENPNFRPVLIIVCIIGVIIFAIAQSCSGGRDDRASGDSNSTTTTPPGQSLDVAPTVPALPEAPLVVDPNEQYLALLDRFRVPQTTDSEMVQIGMLVCSSLDLGMSKEAVGFPLYSGPEFSVGEAGTIVGSAVNVYCPQHEGG